jgi:hypothetical protein
MPSPFPGMDPYLENPAHWREVHHHLITGLKVSLKNRLPPPYYARIDERLYVVQPNRSILPDVSILRRQKSKRAKRRESSTGTLALECDPAWEISVLPEEFHEAFVEIRSKAEPERVVTHIEVLSPTNKQLGLEGRESYCQKQREIQGSPTHLVEIDLLRFGEHTVAPPVDELRSRGAYHYLVSVSRGEAHTDYDVWARTLRERLPRFRVPLTGNDPDVVVDLQAILDRAYEDGDYERMTDYRVPPAVALSPADAKWAAALLRQHGLRK